MQDVADDEGLVDVKLKLAVHATNGSSNMVAHDLRANHGQGLALGRIDLSRHDAAARLVLRQNELAQAAARAAAQVADVLSNLGQRGGESVESARGMHKRVMRSKGLELVGGRLELGASHAADLLGDALSKALKGVNAGADSGTALSEQPQVRQGSLDALDAKVKLGDVARELLSQSQRRGVLEMCAANLDNLLGLELVHLGLQGVSQAAQGRNQLTLDLEDGGDVHDGGEGVVRGGAAVDVIVGVDGFLAALLAAQDLDGSVGDDLVRVHVGLSARAGLPDDQGEVVEQLQVSDLLGRLLNGLADGGVCASKGTGLV